MWIRVAIVAAIFAAGAGAGWGLNGWRLNSKVADLEVELANSQARVAVLEPANEKCAVDVKDVRQAFADWQAAEAKRVELVKAAVAAAAATSKAHLDQAAKIMTAPRPAAGQECPAIIQEEADYVRARQQR
jgi:hypothetical protein